MSGKLLADERFQFDQYLPYYLQVKSLLDTKIDAGMLRPGDRLPSESAICDELGVSRTVVRQALRDMEYEGRIIKRKGKGSYVAEPKILESFLQKLSGFHEDMTAQHRSLRSKVLNCSVVRPTRRAARMLEVSSSTRVVLLRRLRYVDDDPVQVVSSFLPYRLCPDLLAADFTDRSLYEFLHEHSIFLSRGYRTIEAVRASNEDARLMKITRGDPVIRIESIGYTVDGTPVEYYEAVHRGDRTRLRVEVVRKWVRKPNGAPRDTQREVPSVPGIEFLPPGPKSKRAGTASRPGGPHRR